MQDYEIIKLFKKERNIPSDNKAAQIIGVSRAYISDIRNERKPLSESTVIRMTKLAGETIADAWANRCKSRIMDIM